jgi:cytochrome c oxidase assembly protein subunit 15
MMIVIGGVTRLTGSGLSMVEWRPLMGAIPPINHTEWLEVFAKYQASPQYQLVNKGMSLGDFQWIFFWEYFHRLIGRIMGVVFLIPWCWFSLKGYFNRTWALRFLGGFLLGGLQGLMGWIMVASGLVDQPQVSHLRLAAHLLLAFFILAYFWRLGWLYVLPNRYSNPQNSLKTKVINRATLNVFQRTLKIFVVVLVLQTFYGALVAGLRAGYMYNTFPLMEGQFFPKGGWSLVPVGMNLLDNPLLVQWIHRMLGWSLLGLGVTAYWRFRNEVSAPITMGLRGLVAVVLGQFLVGVLTLTLKVSLPLAVIHQVGASVLLLLGLRLLWEVRLELSTQTIVNRC